MKDNVRVLGLADIANNLYLINITVITSATGVRICCCMILQCVCGLGFLWFWLSF